MTLNSHWRFLAWFEASPAYTLTHVSQTVAFEHSRCDPCVRHVTIKSRQTAQLTADMSSDLMIILQWWEIIVSYIISIITSLYPVLSRWSAIWDVCRTVEDHVPQDIHRIQLIRGVYSAYLVQVIEENSAFKIHYQYNQYVTSSAPCTELEAYLPNIPTKKCCFEAHPMWAGHKSCCKKTTITSTAHSGHVRCTVNFQCTLGDRYPLPFCWYVRHEEKWYSSKDTPQPITRNMPTHV